MEFTFLFYKITVRKARRRFITAERAPHLSSVILSGAKRSRRILAPHPRRGVPDDPCRCSTHRRFCNSRANSHRAQRRGGYHPPAQRVPNPHAALRRIRTAPNVGGDDPGTPLSDACRNPARCGHRALQGAAHPNQSGRMKNVRRIRTLAEFVSRFCYASFHRRAATCGPPRTGNETAGHRSPPYVLCRRKKGKGKPFPHIYVSSGASASLRYSRKYAPQKTSTPNAPMIPSSASVGIVTAFAIASPAMKSSAVCRTIASG